MNSDMPTIVNKRPEKEKSDHRAVDALYRISAFASSQPDPKLALEGILDEVMSVFDASSASLCLLDANSDKLLIEVGAAFPSRLKGSNFQWGLGLPGGWLCVANHSFVPAWRKRKSILSSTIECAVKWPLL